MLRKVADIDDEAALVKGEENTVLITMLIVISYILYNQITQRNLWFI